MSNTNVAIKKISTIENLFKLTQSLPNNLEKIVGHHAKFFRGACQRPF
jgi:hypothetical protein